MTPTIKLIANNLPLPRGTLVRVFELTASNSVSCLIKELGKELDRLLLCEDDEDAFAMQMTDLILMGCITYSFQLRMSGYNLIRRHRFFNHRQYCIATALQMGEWIVPRSGDRILVPV
jgi:hypothetical protein